MLPNEDVSRSIVAVYKPLLEANGVQVPIVEYFQPDTQDFAPVLRKFQNQGLDGMLTGTNDALVEAILRQSDRARRAAEEVHVPRRLRRARRSSTPRQSTASPGRS